jgi:hypothetical protein
MSDVPSAAVGRCIYCPALIYSPLEAARKLGDEHIIPAGMGGTLVLPEASCKSCETATSGIESICINNLFSPAVPHFPWKTRAKLKKTFVRVSAGQSGASIKVPLADHPGTLTMFRFEVATEISGLPAPEVFTGKITVGPAMVSAASMSNWETGSARIHLGACSQKSRILMRYRNLDGAISHLVCLG